MIAIGTIPHKSLPGYFTSALVKVLFAVPLAAAGQTTTPDSPATQLFGDEIAAAFLIDAADVVARGTFEFIAENEPADGIGDIGAQYVLKFQPELVFKGDMALEEVALVALSNDYLSYASTTVSRSNMFLIRQDEYRKVKDGFVQQYQSLLDFSPTQPTGNEQEPGPLTDRIAREMTAIAPGYSVHLASAHSRRPVPAWRIVIPGLTYTVLLNETNEGAEAEYELAASDWSLFGGLENVLFMLVIQGSQQ